MAYGRPELSVSVRSDDPAWVLAIAYLAEQLRHECPFSYGDTINFGEPMYPTHAIEREYIAPNGLEAFWELERDPYDVARPPAV